MLNHTPTHVVYYNLLQAKYRNMPMESGKFLIVVDVTPTGITGIENAGKKGPLHFLAGDLFVGMRYQGIVARRPSVL